MKLRARVALTSLAALAPLVAGLILFITNLRSVPLQGGGLAGHGVRVSTTPAAASRHSSAPALS